MASIGDLISSFLQATGKSAVHRRNVTDRGGDYMLKDEAASREARRALLEDSGSVTKQVNERALTQALAQIARRGGLAQTGMNDPEAAAAYTADDMRQTAELKRRSAESAIALQGAQAQHYREGMSPEEMEAFRQENRMALAEFRAKNGGRGSGTEPGTYIEWTKPDGTRVMWNPKSDRVKAGPAGETGGRRTPPAGEVRREGEAGAMISSLRAMQNIKPELLGPLRATGSTVRGGMMGEALGMDPPTAEYSTARALVGGTRDLIINAITGAAATVPEMARLGQHIPDMKQRSTVFYANARITEAGMSLAEDIIAGRIDRPTALARLTEILGGAATPASAPAAGPAPNALEQLMLKHGVR